MTTPHRLEARSLDEAIELALDHLIAQPVNRSGTGAMTLVFAGEGGSAEAALRDALDDLHQQCVAQGCAPVEVLAKQTMQSDAGLRIWGTTGCMPATASGVTLPDIRIREEEGRWIITIRMP